MTDSNGRDYLDSKHGKGPQRRLEAVKRWVEYINREPPETWGPQQNSVVDGQLAAADRSGISADHRKLVETVAAEIAQERDESEVESGNQRSGSGVDPGTG